MEVTKMDKDYFSDVIKPIEPGIYLIVDAASKLPTKELRFKAVYAAIGILQEKMIVALSELYYRGDDN